MRTLAYYKGILIALQNHRRGVGENRSNYKQELDKAILFCRHRIEAIEWRVLRRTNEESETKTD